MIYTSVPPGSNIQTAAAVAVNPDGTEKWRYEEQNIATSPFSLSHDESQAYVSFLNHLITFLNPTGTTTWSRVAPPFSNGMAIVDPQDRIFVLTYPPVIHGGGAISAYSRSGTPLWSTTIGDPRSIALSPAGDIVVLGGNELFRLDPGTGVINTQSGQLDIGNIDIFELSAIDSNGTAYLLFNSFSPGEDSGIMAVDGSDIRWTFPVPPGSMGAAIGSDGTIYLMSQGGLYALGE